MSEQCSWKRQFHQRLKKTYRFPYLSVRQVTLQCSSFVLVTSYDITKCVTSGFHWFFQNPCSRRENDIKHQYYVIAHNEIEDFLLRNVTGPLGEHLSPFIQPQPREVSGAFGSWHFSYTKTAYEYFLSVPLDWPQMAPPAAQM